MSYRAVTTEEGEELAKKYDAVFAEVSSKQSTDLETFIKKVGATLLAHHIS